MLIDKEIVKKRFGRGMLTYDQHASVQRQICAKMVHCMQKHELSSGGRFLEFGCGSGLLTDGVLSTFRPSSYILNDLVAEEKLSVSRLFSQSDSYWEFIEGDAEEISFGNGYDAIISASTLQWFYDLPAFFRKVYNSLAPGGIFAFSTFGPENYTEIRTLLQHGLDYPTKNELTALLKPGFELLCNCDYLEKLHFSNAMEVLRHMKLTGVNGSSQPCISRQKLTDFGQAYRSRYQVPGRDEVTLTYHPIIVIARKRSEIVARDLTLQ